MIKSVKNILRKLLGTKFLRFYRGWIKGFAVRPSKSYSQKGEDLILLHYFGTTKTDGFYLDIGCFHPVQISNTHLFYKKGWRGFAVDIDKYKTDLFKAFRRGSCEVMVAAVVGTVSGGKTANVYKFGDLAGWSDIDTLDYKAAVWQRDVKNAGEFRTEKISKIGINELLADLPNVNFLNIDVEGLDVDIIKALDLEKYDIEVILFEDNVNRSGSKTIRKKFLNHGYELLFISGGSVCYCKKSF